MNTEEKYLPTEFVDRILESYKEEFRYLETDSATFDKGTNTLHCNVAYQWAPYKKRRSKIFNNTEVIFVLNQSAYLMLLCALANIDGVDVYKDWNSDSFKKYYYLLGKFVVKEQHQQFLKPIREDEYPIECEVKLENLEKRGDKTLLVFETIIGKERSFILSTRAYLLKKDLHGYDYEHNPIPGSDHDTT